LTVASTENAGTWSFELINVQGQVMRRAQTNRSAMTFSCTDLAAGLYIATGQHPDGAHFSTPVFIQH
jgi:hypothetical protein